MKQHDPTRQIVLVHPSGSLSQQMRKWLERHRERKLSLVEQHGDGEMPDALVSLTDAETGAERALEEIRKRHPRQQNEAVAAYGEHADHSFERTARSEGAMYLIGPLEDQEWNEVIDWAEAMQQEKQHIETVDMRNIRRMPV